MRKLNDSSQTAAGDHEHDMDSIGDRKPTDILVEATPTDQSTAGREGGDQPSLTEDETDHHNIVSDMLLSERVSFYPNTLQHPATGGAKELSPPRGVSSAAVTLRGAGYKVPQSCDIKPGPNSKGQLVASNKGGAKLLYEGYNYTMKKSVNHHVYWICAHRKKIGCTGSLRTTRALEAHKTLTRHTHDPGSTTRFPMPENGSGEKPVKQTYNQQSTGLAASSQVDNIAAALALGKVGNGIGSHR